MPKSKETLYKIDNNESSRHQWISEAAYFKAETRDFESGKELDDWLEAENEYIEFLIQVFLLRCEEDGGISILCLQELANLIGVTNSRNITSEVELIRHIQEAAHHRPCFRTTYQQPCEDPESECPWRSECQKIIAVWHR